MKILGITTIRSDFDLMSLLYQQLDSCPEIEFKILVSGAHLSHTYANGSNSLNRSNLSILANIESLLDSNSSSSRLKSASIMLLSCIDVVSNYSPNLIIYSGDREDTMVGALLGSYLQVPTLHFYGGDHVSDGHVDNPIRHAVSKLSSIHFVTLESHKRRLIQMGENEARISVIGSPSLDRFRLHKKIAKTQVLKKYSIPDHYRDYALVIFHPHDIEMKYSAQIMENIFEALIKLKEFVIVGYPNSDPGSRGVIDVIEKYKGMNNIHAYTNLSNEDFLDIMMNAKIQIGNSSSGILEAASIPIPVVNVGIRQAGREQSGNVIYSTTSKKEIFKMIKHALSTDNLERVSKVQNIYGDGYSSEKAFKLIRAIQFNNYLYKTEDPLHA
jgi:UDP-hydrolysing UDP-N-acetyl-D-glucosamine 2-epimerase